VTASAAAARLTALSRVSVRLSRHLNAVCRVENVSLGGWAVEWGRRYRPPALNGVTEAALLQTRDMRGSFWPIVRGSYHPQGKGCVIGLDLSSAPRNFVLGFTAQRLLLPRPTSRQPNTPGEKHGKRNDFGRWPGTRVRP
jgi:hypothetical protein